MYKIIITPSHYRHEKHLATLLSSKRVTIHSKLLSNFLRFLALEKILHYKVRNFGGKKFEQIWRI